MATQKIQKVYLHSRFLCVQNSELSSAATKTLVLILLVHGLTFVILYKTDDL